ncbi:MAG: hypothetical protein A2539_04340 [Elusimicrobia bacterium RIFOXYD2_FULL_34_15]|nr:MAG: hypothetical protein A2539_04340 [Elusimicrobia bacterium RIFOXYD2_FULL_34_15]
MKEFSAGGIIIESGKILLVKVKNLSGKIRWTFPKGHIEKGETVEQTAKREVLEETGYNCEIIKSLGETKYNFYRGKDFVYKKVKWFLMKPVEKLGKHDDEIMTTRWANITEMKKYLKYKSDLQLLEKIL